MSTYKTAQRWLSHRGRDFHFVSYEGMPANPRRDQEATEPTWFLMNEGKRFAVAPHFVEQDVEELEVLFIAWLEENVFLPEPVAADPPPKKKRARRVRK